jgi:hypothetical protein
MQSIKEHNLKANHNFVPLNTYWFLLCMQSIKEHNLKANHNRLTQTCCYAHSVCNLSKNTIWKQITTLTPDAWSRSPLYAIYQRTQSESKSQPLRSYAPVSIVCMQSIKEHNLKANHNRVAAFELTSKSVCNLSKNTPARAGWNKSESKSQPVTTGATQRAVCMQSIKEHSR